MMAIARVQAHIHKRDVNAVIAELWPTDHAIIAIGRAAAGVADTTTAGWAAELIRMEIRQMLEKDLAPISVAAALAVRGRRLNFLGAQSTIVPAMTTRGKATAGAWIGEGGVIPVKQGQFTSKRIYRYKLAAITTVTKELERASDPEAVAVLRDMMLQDSANALDGYLLDALPEVVGIRPAGLLNGVATTAGAAGGGQAAVDADIKTLWTAMINAGAGSKPVLIINSASAIGLAMMTNALGQYIFRDDIRANNLLGLSVVASTNVPALTATLVDADCFANAFDPPEVETSEEATLTMADAGAAAPTQAMNAAGALGVAEQVPPDRGISVSGGTAGAASAGYQALSLFQTWSIGIRNVMPIGWGMTRPGAVQGVTAITW
jgi:HK97 family phage major capsid protein